MATATDTASNASKVEETTKLLRKWHTPEQLATAAGITVEAARIRIRNVREAGINLEEKECPELRQGTRGRFPVALRVAAKGAK